MKNLLTGITLLIVSFVNAQDYIGLWSFESVDKERIDSTQFEVGEIESTLLDVENMFRSFSMTLKKDMTFDSDFMAQLRDQPYKVDGQNIILRNMDTIQLLSPARARMDIGGMYVIIKKGASDLPEYRFLIEESYGHSPIDERLLKGLWNVVEVRYIGSSKGKKLIELMFSEIIFNFTSNSKLELSDLDGDKNYDYNLDEDKNTLVLSQANSGNNNTKYVINQLDDQSMIMTNASENLLLYLVKK